MGYIQQGAYNPEISNIAKETGGNLASMQTDISEINGNIALLSAKDFSTEASLIGIKNTADKFQFDASDYLKVNIAAGGAGNGSILDGVDTAIKASVLDYTNSNPLAVRLTDVNGDYVGAGAGEQYADGTIVNAAYKGTLALGTDGSNYQILATDASGNLQVDILNGSIAVTGTFWQATQPVSATDLDIRNLTNTDVVTAELSATDNAVLDAILVDTTAIKTAQQIMDDWDNAASDGASISGDTAHDAADAGEPVKIGCKAVLFDGSAPPNAAVAEGDRTNAISDEYGRQFVETTHPNYWRVSADYAEAQTNASVKATPGAGLSIYITDVCISNGATAGNITLLDGSGGTVVYEIYPAINGGSVHSLRTPIKLTANTALCCTSVTCTTHSLNLSGFIAP